MSSTHVSSWEWLPVPAALALWEAESRGSVGHSGWHVSNPRDLSACLHLPSTGTTSTYHPHPTGEDPLACTAGTLPVEFSLHLREEVFSSEHYALLLCRPAIPVRQTRKQRCRGRVNSEGHAGREWHRRDEVLLCRTP